MTAPPPNLKARALQALARREHTRQELRAKLQPHTDDAQEIENLLDELERRGWLSEARFVEQLTLVRRRKYGAGRILQELREKGVSEASIDQAQSALKRDEFEAAREVWRRKFGVAAKSLQEKAKQARFLAGRGFSAEVVHAVLKASGKD